MSNNKTSISKKDIGMITVISVKILVICSVIALLVATVNHFTAPVIEKNNNEKTRLAIVELFGEGISYEKMTIPEDIMEKSVAAVYSVKSADGQSLGYAAECQPVGFKDVIYVLAAINNDLTIKEVKVTNTNSETKGIGTKVADKSFLSEFAGKSGDIEDQVDTISGATKSSKPVIDGVSTALKLVGKLKGEAE